MYWNFILLLRILDTSNILQNDHLVHWKYSDYFYSYCIYVIFFSIAIWCIESIHISFTTCIRAIYTKLQADALKIFLFLLRLLHTCHILQNGHLMNWNIPISFTTIAYIQNCHMVHRNNSGFFYDYCIRVIFFKIAIGCIEIFSRISFMTCIHVLLHLMPICIRAIFLKKMPSDPLKLFGFLLRLLHAMLFHGILFKLFWLLVYI